MSTWPRQNPVDDESGRPGDTPLEAGWSTDPSQDQSRTASLLREEQAVRARLERQVAHLLDERDQLLLRFDERDAHERRHRLPGDSPDAPAATRPDAAQVAQARREAASAGGRDTRGPAARGALKRVAAVVAGLALVGAAFAAGTLVADERDDATPAATPRAERPAALAAAPLMPCSSIARGAEYQHRVVCSLRGRRLTLAAGQRLVEASGFEVRVLRVTRTTDAAVVRLGVRNTTATAHTLARSPRELYISVGDRRIHGQAAREQSLAPGAQATLELRFPLDAGAVQRLSAAAGRFDVGVVPLGTDPARRESIRAVGVVRARA